MSPWAAAAVRNNAHWCDLVCRLHGASTTSDDAAWTSATRTPPHYPDAITLAPDVSATDLLARIDHSAGCSVKDSYASLDLNAFGFRVLFDAQWIVRAAQPLDRRDELGRWERVRSPEDLGAWERAWQGEGGPSGLFTPALLDHGHVTVLASYRHGAVAAGAILNHDAGVVGISNFFAPTGAGGRAWQECVATAHDLHPGVPLVGYEAGARLDEAIAAGFTPAGPLRVWIRDG